MSQSPSQPNAPDTRELTTPETTNSPAPSGASLAHFVRQAILVYMRPYWKQYALIVVTMLMCLAFDTIFPLGVTFLIDWAIVPKNGRLLAILIVALAALLLVAAAGNILHEYLCSRVGTRLLNDLRLKMFRHLQNLPARYYACTPTGDITARFTTDLDALEHAFAQLLPFGLFSLLRLSASVVVLFVLEWRLALVMAILLPVTVLGPRTFVARATEANYRRKQKEAALSSTVQEHVGAHNVIRAFGLREPVTAAFARQLAEMARNNTSALFLQRMVAVVTDLGQWTIQLLVIALGAVLVFRGSLSVGAWVGFNTLLLNVGYAISTLAAVISDLIPATAGLHRVEELLNEPVRVFESPHPVTLPRLSQEIRFDHVNFGYEGCDAPRILHGVDLRIPASRSVAFVGRSGSGKSTLLNLVMRFYDPDEGRVLIDGHELSQVSEASLRSQMAAVFQDTFLFNTTVRENIRLGKLEATDEEVEAAAKAAEIHDLIMELPQGYDTIAGERGGRLSGGQRQRIALARAIIRDPAILVLDEATSALDPETEAAINRTLKGLAQNRTMLSVTHRLAPVASMDQIVVLDRGRVAEMGSHQDLLKQQGIYFQLWNQQSGFMISSDGLHAEVTASRLRAIPLFAELDEATLNVIARQLVTERYDADQVIFTEGAPGDKFYIIVRGKVSVTTVKPDRQVVQLDVWQDGDYFGEIALLEGVPRTATVRTLLPSLFLTLRREQFLKLLDEIPSMRKAVEQSAQSRRLNLVLSGDGHRGG